MNMATLKGPSDAWALTVFSPGFAFDGTVSRTVNDPALLATADPSGLPFQ